MQTFGSKSDSSLTDTVQLFAIQKEKKGSNFMRLQFTIYFYLQKSAPAANNYDKNSMPDKKSSRGRKLASDDVVCDPV